MKKFTSVVLTALTAVFLACAFSACNNLNGTGNAPVIEGCYSGVLTPSSGLDPFTLTIFVRSDGFVNFYDEHDDFDGTVTLNGHGFTVTGTSARSEVTWNITGTVSSDGLKLCNITINGDRYDGELTLQDVHLFGIFAGEVSRSGEEPFGVSISSFNYSDEGNSCSFTIGTVSFPEARWPPGPPGAGQSPGWTPESPWGSGPSGRPAARTGPSGPGGRWRPAGARRA